MKNTDKAVTGEGEAPRELELARAYFLEKGMPLDNMLDASASELIADYRAAIAKENAPDDLGGCYYSAGEGEAPRETYNLSRRYFPEGYETSNGQMIEDEGWYILAGGMWIFDN